LLPPRRKIAKFGNLVFFAAIAAFCEIFRILVAAMPHNVICGEFSSFILKTAIEPGEESKRMIR
jgi:hypothetical protein